MLSLEARRQQEIAKLIRTAGGEPTVVPFLREVPIADNPAVFAFYEQLRGGAYDLVVLMTGVGTRYMDQVLQTRHGEGALAEALRTVTVACRGPKPVAVLREWKVPFAVVAPEPNTWRELLAAVAGREERRVAVQEYGKPNPALLEGLRAQGREVTAVGVYQYAMPEERAEMEQCWQQLEAGQFDVLLLTTGVQVRHLAAIAGSAERLQSALARVAICSVGPTTSEALVEEGLRPDLEPAHPKMGFLVKEAAEQCETILARKRRD